MESLWDFAIQLEAQLMLGAAGILIGSGMLIVGFFRLIESSIVHDKTLKNSRKSWGKNNAETKHCHIKAYVAQQPSPLSSIVKQLKYPSRTSPLRLKTPQSKITAVIKTKIIKEKFNHKKIFIKKINVGRSIQNKMVRVIKAPQTTYKQTQKSTDIEIKVLIKDCKESGNNIKDHVNLTDIIDIRNHLFPFSPFRKHLEKHKFSHVIYSQQDQKPIIAITSDHNYPDAYLQRITKILKEEKIDHKFS